MSNKYFITKYMNKVIRFKFCPSSLYHPHEYENKMMVGYVHIHFDFSNLIIVSSSENINTPANRVIYGPEVVPDTIKVVSESEALLFKLISNF